MLLRSLAALAAAGLLIGVALADSREAAPPVTSAKSIAVPQPARPCDAQSPVPSPHYLEAHQTQYFPFVPQFPYPNDFLYQERSKSALKPSDPAARMQQLL